MSNHPPSMETPSQRRNGGQGFIAFGVAAAIFGGFGLYEDKPAVPSLLTRFFMVFVEPRIASSVADMFLVAFGVFAVIYGLLHIKGKA